MQEICSSWPAALDLVRRPSGGLAVCYCVILLYNQMLIRRLGSLDSVFLTGCVASQPPGRWASRLPRHLANTWDTSHVPHHCPMRRSSEPQRTRRVLPRCLWRFSASVHLFIPFALPFLFFFWFPLKTATQSEGSQILRCVVWDDTRNPWCGDEKSFSFTCGDHVCRQFICSMHKSSLYNCFASSTGPFYNMTPEERIDADNRSVYVGNVRLVYLSFLHIEHVFVFVTHLIWHTDTNPR